MEELLNNLSGVAVTEHHNTPHAEHPHYALYKAKSTGSSQEQRRKSILEARREARYDLLSHLRSIEEQSLSSDGSSDDMECEQAKVIYSRPKKYRNFIMLSEWLVDVPEDFASTYLSVLCPVGKRTLVVSGKGRTRAYYKSGMMAKQFPSALPGGCRHNNFKGYAVLDCIWSEINKTYYILDLVMWVNQSIMECETQFRFEWLRSRIEEETPELSQASKYNPFRFIRLPYYSCSRESLAKLVTEPLPFDVPLDGILFYHFESHYTHGPTPLVGWLKAYMFPEILGINDILENYINEKPSRYMNLSSHIQYGKERRERTLNKMDTTGNKATKPQEQSEKREKEKAEDKMDAEAMKPHEQSRKEKNGTENEDEMDAETMKPHEQSEEKVKVGTENIMDAS